MARLGCTSTKSLSRTSHERRFLSGRRTYSSSPISCISQPHLARGLVQVIVSVGAHCTFTVYISFVLEMVYLFHSTQNNQGMFFYVLYVVSGLVSRSRYRKAS